MDDFLTVLKEIWANEVARFYLIAVGFPTLVVMFLMRMGIKHNWKEHEREKARIWFEEQRRQQQQ